MDKQQELAEFFRDHPADDPDEWEVDEGEPGGDPRPRRAYGVGLTATVTVRFSPEETDAMRRTAKENGLTYSALVREAVRAYTRPATNRPATSATISFSSRQSAPSLWESNNLHQPGGGETQLAESNLYRIAGD